MTGARPVVRLFARGCFPWSVNEVVNMSVNDDIYPRTIPCLVDFLIFFYLLAWHPRATVLHSPFQRNLHHKRIKRWLVAVAVAAKAAFVCVDI
jgi:hypothetical protein